MMALMKDKIMIMTHLKKSYNYIWYLAASLVILATLALLSGFVPQHEGNYLRRHVSTTIVKLGPEDMPAPIVNATGWSMRAPISTEVINLSDAHMNVEQNNQLLDFVNNNIAISTTHGAKNVEGNTKFNALVAALPGDAGPFSNALSSPLPTHYGEALNIDGRPLRFVNENSEAHVAKNSYALACAVEQDSLERIHRNLVTRIAMPPRNESTLQRARRYKTLVQNAAKRFQLSESLLFAIIQTESNFSPALVSSQSAMGLMQLLPSTAGGEVHRYLHGHTATMTLDDLSKPDLNILFGATYLHLLLTRHLGGVEDPLSRKYCALAAYNMGPGRLVRFFGSDRDDAIANINKLSAEEVYIKLTEVLPIAETRAYVSRVTSRQAQFEGAL